METYKWKENENYSFEFITDTYDVYWVNFKQNEDLALQAMQVAEEKIKYNKKKK